MSADNGIYIAEFMNGTFRVAYAMAIENVDYFPVGSKERKAELKAYFGQSPVFGNEQSASAYAGKLHRDIEREGGYTEYGICKLIPIYENWDDAPIQEVIDYTDGYDFFVHTLRHLVNTSNSQLDDKLYVDRPSTVIDGNDTIYTLNNGNKFKVIVVPVV